ncbi:hypothetical protein BT67DRAFT_370703 [Trichocladium antarcticum]|uniref:non-specific serine/threonine protein kinase n=1 Tax=Trichocladium antarcticum TaxID=1450529 RepID=A0AAN6URQ6_9PEZI|nr:hypothetical protein BT67DRAFT_370703 [Trichocladium antarcticum]
MSRTTTVRKYGKSVRKTRAEELFAQLPRSPVKSERVLDSEPLPGLELRPEVRLELGSGLGSRTTNEDEVARITEQLVAFNLNEPAITERKTENRTPGAMISENEFTCQSLDEPNQHGKDEVEKHGNGRETKEHDLEHNQASSYDNLSVLGWDEVCRVDNRIEKIAEASYAEVYRITNDQGTSIIKVVRLESPIKPQTKAQERSGLVDEEPHADDDMFGELHISEWLAAIPGFVVYKERYVVRGRAPKALLETHQAFHRRMKRQDPDRLQYYPSPSRYLDDTRFLVVELGDAGTALEDFPLTSVSQLWDIFLHTALALARAEDLIEFEHRDLHEGNLCIRAARPPTPPSAADPANPLLKFGLSGLDITILDYGLSRATSPTSPAIVTAPDLEKDPALFTSTHAPQCAVYRQMRAFLLTGDRIPPTATTTLHQAAAAAAAGEPLSWQTYAPYTNVLWLAYLYGYLARHFAGPREWVRGWRRETAELWKHLDPRAPRQVLSFPSAGEVVRFAVEAGWMGEEQVVGDGSWLGPGREGDEDGRDEGLVAEGR